MVVLSCLSLVKEQLQLCGCAVLSVVHEGTVTVVWWYSLSFSFVKEEQLQLCGGTVFLSRSLGFTWSGLAVFAGFSQCSHLSHEDNPL